MNRLTIATWNAEGMFVSGTKTRRGTPHDAVAVVARINADIVVIPEFGLYQRLLPEIEQLLKAQGYYISLMPYKDKRAPGFSLAVLSRLPIRRVHTHTLTEGSDNALELYCDTQVGQLLRVIAVHLDFESEARRLKQVKVLAQIISIDKYTPTLVLGDMNAMHKEDRFARLMRHDVVRRLAKYVPHHQLASILGMVQQMAQGTTIEALVDTQSLMNLDPRHTPTISAKQRNFEWMPHVALAKIDWIFGTKQFRTLSYQVLPDVGSDHRPVVAALEYK
ncbi:MAG: endonuclease/exonuclease/phosphatase family protein [Candidatus Saccharimonas sp.]